MGCPYEEEEEEEVNKSRRNKARLFLSPSDSEHDTMHEAGTVSAASPDDKSLIGAFHGHLCYS